MIRTVPRRIWVLYHTTGGQDLCNRLAAYRQVVTVAGGYRKTEKEVNVRVRRYKHDI